MRGLMPHQNIGTPEMDKFKLEERSGLRLNILFQEMHLLGRAWFSARA